MGCDIHLYAEVKQPGGKWKIFHPFDAPCEECNGKPTRDKKPCWDCDGKGTAKHMNGWYHWRNYDVFAILANVRNGHGFAGCVTGSGFKPISDPRGLPDDTSVKDSVEDTYPAPDYINLGDHSFTWLMLDEILNYDWSQTTKKQGVVNVANYKLWAKTGEPESWSGDVGGPSVIKVSPEEMDQLIAKEKASNSEFIGGHYTTVRWEKKYSAVAGAFLDRMQILKEFAERAGYQPTEVRLVMGFDS